MADNNTNDWVNDAAEEVEPHFVDPLADKRNHTDVDEAVDAAVSVVEDLEQLVLMLADAKNWHINGGACRWLNGNKAIFNMAQDLVVRHGLG